MRAQKIHRPYRTSLCRLATIMCTLLTIVGAVGAFGPAPHAQAGEKSRHRAPDNAVAYFIWPADGAVIQGGRFWVRMGLRNMGVAPRGVDLPNVGHHHLLIDTEPPALDEAIPSDRNHLHFGAGETEARIELPPGTHTLQMLLGDRDHVPHDPPLMSKKISITVK